MLREKRGEKECDGAQEVVLLGVEKMGGGSESGHQGAFATLILYGNSVKLQRKGKAALHTVSHESGDLRSKQTDYELADSGRSGEVIPPDAP